MMKGKHIAVLCSCLALCAAAAAFAGCDKKDETLFGDWVTTVEATCEGEGLQTRVSLTDSSVIETRAIPATGHDWNAWTEVTAPTCLTNGMQKRTCNTCDNEDFGAIPALGHSWGAWETVAEPTCIAEGYKERVCEADSTHTQTEA
ncbi:MAG: hypothetical protein K2N74_05505, partial [Clostridiales bacterium]|nr:hypothetical protein [Clostridiales bacterium]